jgi:hypothetical protein
MTELLSKFSCYGLLGIFMEIFYLGEGSTIERSIVGSLNFNFNSSLALTTIKTFLLRNGLVSSRYGYFSDFPGVASSSGISFGSFMNSISGSSKVRYCLMQKSMKEKTVSMMAPFT